VAQAASVPNDNHGVERALGRKRSGRLDRPPAVAVLNALTYLGCEVDTDYIARRWNGT